MLPATTARLARIPNIVGIKDATGELGRLNQLKESCGDGFDLFSGDDATACEFILGGGHGVISVTANVAPRLMQEMCAAALAHERERALAVNERLDALHHDLFVQSNPIPVKWAVSQMGLMGPTIRLPLTPYSEEHHAAMRAAMATAGVEVTSGS